MHKSSPASPDPDPHGPAQQVNWEDFRDHLATADKQGNRRWIYPKKPAGPWYDRRTYVSWLLLAIMFAELFIRINGNPLLMIDIVSRRFSILGQIFWPQDTLLFAVAILVFVVASSFLPQRLAGFGAVGPAHKRC